MVVESHSVILTEHTKILGKHTKKVDSLPTKVSKRGKQLNVLTMNLSKA